MGLHTRLPCRSMPGLGPALRWLWLALACAAGAQALASAPPGAPQREDEPVPAMEVWRQWRSVLFRVQAPAAAADVPAAASSPEPVNFIFGTIHFGDPEELALDVGVMREAMRHTRVLLNEVDNDAHWDASKERYRLLATPAGLPGLIGPQAYAELQRLLPAVSPALLHRLKPWAALALLEARGEVAGEQTLDRRLERWAADMRLRTEHLETLDEQLAALDCVPSAEQALVLRQRLRTPWLFSEQSARVLEYYRSRNLAAWLDEIDAMVGLDARARPIEERARQCLIEARNERWLPKLDAMLRRGGTFVAVGAIHLTGAAGLLERLRQRGFLIVAEPL